MKGVFPLIEEFLPFVTTPGQYVGGELNSIVKDPDGIEFRMALAFPDSYGVGMSHIGLKILYHVLNSEERWACERAFCPWPDMADRLRARRIPLFSLETHTPLRDFDAVGFSLQYELCCTNVLMMLELAEIPVLSAERTDLHPVIVAGGTGAFSPEPLANFIDVFIVGEGEEAIVELARVLVQTKGMKREERLLSVAREVGGAYVPAFYRPGKAGAEPTREGPPRSVERRVVADLDAAPYPTSPVVPFVQTVHERLPLEIMRGCANGCRFCQAGMIYRPQRERSVKTLVRQAEEGYRATGYDEIGLSSLSTSDYSRMGELVSELTRRFDPLRVSLSLPSLRVDERLKDLPALVSGVRKTGLTIAPECASDSLRRAINKPIENEHLFGGVKAAFRAGYDLVKLYFMVGLPGETDDDVRGIAEMTKMVLSLGKGRARINLSVSAFVPKAQTPFQWVKMESRDELARKLEIVRTHVGSKAVRFKFHDVEMGRLEGVFARGDRRLGKVLLRARALGCMFDAWSEHFSPENWKRAFEEEGIDPEDYLRERSLDEGLPWGHISGGATLEFLKEEAEKARRGESTPPCTQGDCAGCGACDKGK